MNVVLLAHTQLSEKFYDSFDIYGHSYEGNKLDNTGATDGQAVALSAIRTCYSPGNPSEIVVKEGVKYFGARATDGKEGTEADRLFRQIVASKHTSTLEHISFTFAIESVSRALLAQLTRHRVGFSFSVQSQRYVRFGSDDRSGGFDYAVPETIKNSAKTVELELNANTKHKYTAEEYFELFMQEIQSVYDKLRELGVPAEDARAVLPNAAATNLVMTANLRALLDFYAKRREGRGAQGEICSLAEELRKQVVAVEPWVDQFFEGA
ncbi:FAD-dependent thymidylate synthase [Mesobacillus zeae]|uniref:FAD-dependent thymidylate synthase n=2 Tax=Mesobacillus zeae TaxID=1917180 RepID=A0A398BKI3_9BACI|nr:FAD-dependent thymidylate synthase [Mesobacillus zeae]